MKQLTKIQTAERDTLAERLKELHATLNDAITACNAAMADAYAQVEEAASEYNEAISDVVTWRDALVEQMDGYASDRSDKWQESDAAATYGEWKDAFESLEAEEYEASEPDALDEIATDVAEELLALPTAVTS
jgi:phage/plasmid-associated DNA primase